MNALHAARERFEALLHRRQLGSPDDTESPRARHVCGENSREVRRVSKAERDAGDVSAGAVATRRHIDGLRKLWSDALCRVLELEAVADDHVEATRAVLPEILLEVCGRLG